MKNKKSLPCWKTATKDKNYGVRGHKLFAVLSFVDLCAPISYRDLNEFCYDYTRRGKKNSLFTGRKYDKVKDRGYIGTNLYHNGYIGVCLDKCKWYPGYYELSQHGIIKLTELCDKFGYDLGKKMLKKLR